MYYNLKTFNLIYIFAKWHLLYKWTLLVCLSSVRLYPINVKTAEPIGPNLVWDLSWPQGRNGWSKFQILAFNKIRLSLHLKIHEIIFIKSANFFCFCFTMYTKRKCWHWKRRWPGAKRPESPVDHTFAVILSLKKLCYQLKMFNLLKIIFKFSIFYLKGL